jgi:hypothetical protein
MSYTYAGIKSTVMRQKLWCTLVILTCVFSLYGQSVFAPVKGAEWKYFTSSIWEVSELFPGSFSYKSIVTIKYEKDTIVNKLNAKKLTQTEIMRVTKNKKDTIQYRNPAPLLIVQRNDSVLVWSPEHEEFALCFTYNNLIGNVSTYGMPLRSSLTFSLQLGRVSNFRFQGSSSRFTNYTSKTKNINNLFDVCSVDSVHILDRIGPLNADITHVGSNFVPCGGAVGYRLMCYRDTEVGELVLEPTGCNDRLVNTKVLELETRDYFHCTYDGTTLSVHWKDEKSVEGKTIEIFDSTGKCIRTLRSDVTEDFFSDLPKGLLLIRIISKAFPNTALIQKVFTY